MSLEPKISISRPSGPLLVVRVRSPSMVRVPAAVSVSPGAMTPKEPLVTKALIVPSPLMRAVPLPLVLSRVPPIRSSS